MGHYRFLMSSMGWPFMVIGFLGRLPVAMIVVGVLTMVTASRGSLAEAGIASAAVGIASGIGGPLVGAAADRFGQRSVLTAAAVLNSSALIALVIAVESPVSIGVVVACAALTGLSSPQLSPMARARWVGMLQRNTTAKPEHVNSAMAYESTADEITFIFGPVIVGLLASLISPIAPIIGAVIITLTFVIAFAWHESIHHVVGRISATREAAPLHTIVRLRVIVPLLGMTTIGAIFGTVLTSLTEFMAERGQETSTGLLYGAMSVTSASLSLAAGLLPARFALRWRWLAAAGTALAASFAFPFIDSIIGAIVVLLLLGVGIGPAMVTIFSIAVNRAPFGRMTTMMTIFGSSIVVGQSLATVIVSQWISTSGYQTGFTTVVGLVGFLVALASVNALLNRGETELVGSGGH